MKRSSYWIFAAILGLVAAGVLFPRYARTQVKIRQAESAGEPASSFEAESAVTVSPAAQARVGIRAVALTARSARRRIAASAIILSAQSLVSLRKAYVMAQTAVEKARVQLGVSRKEYARLETLYRDDQNISQKTLQSAQATVGSDRIDLRAAREQLALQASMVRQNWGNAVTKWVEKPSSSLDQVLAHKEILVEVSITATLAGPTPQVVRLSLPGGGVQRANFVSPLPQVDPRVQGISLLYLTPAREGLAPGVTLVAQLPVGRRLRGVVVPASAVVWSAGQSWVYTQTSSNSFARRPIAANFPVAGGYFVSHGFRAGEKVVVSGAQILLSEELSPPGSSTGEADEDDD